MSELQVEFDGTVWILIPQAWPHSGYATAKTWAPAAAEIVGNESTESTPQLVAWLSGTLEKLASSVRPNEQTYLYLPTITDDFMVVIVGFADAEGDRDSTLRAAVGEADANAVERPIVEEYETPQLGSGYRAVRYLPGAVIPGTTTSPVSEVVAYAFRSGGLDVRVHASDSDLERINRLIPEIEKFITGLSVNEG